MIEAYTETHRANHRLEHLQHLITLLHAAGAMDAAVFWASFYHDYVYEPGKSSNEMKSSKIAAEQLNAMGVNATLIKRVSALILATQDHKLAETDYEAALFLDADMAILGENRETYLEYVNAIEHEFAQVPTFLYKRGRKFFLKQLLNEKRIFSTDWFFARYEEGARKNIAWELNNL